MPARDRRLGDRHDVRSGSRSLPLRSSPFGRRSDRRRLRGVRDVGAASAIETVSGIGRGLLLALDLLIAADVIRTVTLDARERRRPGRPRRRADVPRVSLFVELNGCWPWQRAASSPMRLGAARRVRGDRRAATRLGDHAGHRLRRRRSAARFGRLRSVRRGPRSRRGSGCSPR